MSMSKSFDDPISIKKWCDDIMQEYRDDPYQAHEREDRLLRLFIDWLLKTPRPTISQAVEIAKIIAHNLLDQKRTKWYA